jgi:hypothetical protein
VTRAPRVTSCAGRSRTNVDFSVIRRFQVGEAKRLEFRAEFFSLFNYVNFDNSIGNLNAAFVDQNAGQITNPTSLGASLPPVIIPG